MAATFEKARNGGSEAGELAGLRELLVEEKHRVERLLRRVDDVLGRMELERHADGKREIGVSAPRPSPLDKVQAVIGATKDLRLPNGKLSAGRVAKLYGISLSQLAAWLGRTKQALSKTPDADSLQSALGYFERVARLRAVTASDAEFRKWLRMANETLGERSPLDLLKAGKWQEIADKADDMLTGMPT